MMFLGHYAVGFLLKKKFNALPLWILFIAVQLVDILAFTLVLFDVEKMSYNPTSNPFLRTSMDYIPFTHSLSSSLGIALIVFLVFWKLKNKTWGIALSMGVISHWFIDFIAHKPDMPLIFDSYKVGLGLWNYPWIAFLVEIGFFIGAGYYLYKDSENLKRPIILMAILVIFYTPTMFAPEGEVPVVIVGILSLSFYTIFAVLTWWTERGKK
ncbi:hypothetical protein V7O66_04225 [Methanolobus sp. ZRKC3]|uniref:hypothetical protein n=1 Tax=Methanolobus sp. ZRKC3 TaxID=3125786 RepID=UPI003253E7F2